ncbi:D-alanyl-D-alanine carboxypeptidase family protein [Tissierella sp.]|uniref:D-alanyl-D-alanine carboxypeptidase family protein n=1 Tax=Tissierella sp. TaxID=41274 RepID=UPI00285ACD6C|nr:D-alanyl-D-alanine carboxypeptidase family protein [Tissierella sp.]MDR7856166.1 D-alanyl-D-alanine carboxypeptidase family protein [Tissierella sp.]
MKRKLLSIILLLLIIFPISTEAYAVEDLKINAKSALLMDVNTGEIIYSLNENDRLAPASITKIMTLLLAIEAVDSGRISLKDEVVISKHASGMGGSQVYLEAGEIQIVEDLFKATSIRSANDAAVALAEFIAGSEEIFVNKMNDRAKSLGMKNTYFVNASGLPNENHYTSAYDVALMSRELLKHDKVHDWLTIYMYDLAVGKTKSGIQTMVNTNRMIKEYEGTTGIKTGSTNEAGYCLSSSAKRGNLELISVVMGADNSKNRFNEAKKMLDYGFANYDSVSIGKKGDTIATLPVEKGKLQEVEIILEKDIYVLLPKGEQGNIEKEIILPDQLDAPIIVGDEAGTLVLLLNGKEVDRIKLVSKSTIEKANLINILGRTINGYLNGR